MIGSGSPTSKRSGLKLPEIPSSLRKKSASPESIKRGGPASIRETKKKKSPKRRKEQISSSLSPSPEERNAPGRISGLSSNPNLDIEISPAHKKKRRKPRFLPKINHSVVVKESKKKRSLSPGSKSPARAPSAKPKKKKKKKPENEFQVKLDTSESDDLGEIKEARMASRRAIEMLMADMKKRQRKQVWVPSGNQAYVFHSNLKPTGSPRQKVRLH